MILNHGDSPVQAKRIFPEIPAPFNFQGARQEVFMKTCNFDGCDRPHKAKGYCCSHYSQLRRFGRTWSLVKNEYRFKGDICFVSVRSKDGFFKYEFMIDREDYQEVSKHVWCDTKGYVCCRDNGRVVYIHNFLMGVVPGVIYVDHRKRTPKDNRKKNLRVCSHMQNTMNCGKQKNNKAGFKGVSWCNIKKKWRAAISANGKYFHIGYFNDPIEAAEAYNIAAKTHHGEFACINNVQQSIGRRG